MACHTWKAPQSACWEERSSSAGPLAHEGARVLARAGLLAPVWSQHCRRLLPECPLHVRQQTSESCSRAHLCDANHGWVQRPTPPHPTPPHPTPPHPTPPHPTPPHPTPPHLFSRPPAHTHAHLCLGAQLGAQDLPAVDSVRRSTLGISVGARRRHRHVVLLFACSVMASTKMSLRARPETVIVARTGERKPPGHMCDPQRPPEKRTMRPPSYRARPRRRREASASAALAPAVGRAHTAPSARPAQRRSPARNAPSRRRERP